MLPRSRFRVPEVCTIYDMNPSGAVQARRRFYEFAASSPKPVARNAPAVSRNPPDRKECGGICLSARKMRKDKKDTVHSDASRNSMPGCLGKLISLNTGEGFLPWPGANFNPVLARRVSAEDVVQEALLAACGKMAFFENNPEIPVYFKLRMILLPDPYGYGKGSICNASRETPAGK